MATKEERAQLQRRAEQMRQEALAKETTDAPAATAAPPVQYAADDMSDEAIAWRVSKAAGDVQTDPEGEDAADVDDEDMEVVNRQGGAIVKADAEPVRPVVPFAEDVVPRLLGLETAPPVLANTAEQMAIAESIREQFKGKLPDSAIEAMISAGVGTIQKLSDVESFFSTLPHAYRLQSLTLELRRALRAIEAEAVQLCDDYNNSAPPGVTRPSIVFSLRTGQFVTTFEQQAINAASGEESGTKRRRRTAGEAAESSGNGGGKKNKTRPTLYQFAAYQRMGRDKVVPGFMMKYDERKHFFALVPDGASAMKIVEATWNNGFVVVPGGQEFTAISSVASYVARGTSVNGWDMVQWPEPGKPSGWTDRKDAEYNARVLNWATTNHVGMDSADSE
jgi:hypothetical protein